MSSATSLTLDLVTTTTEAATTVAAATEETATSAAATEPAISLTAAAAAELSPLVLSRSSSREQHHQLLLTPTTPTSAMAATGSMATSPASPASSTSSSSAFLPEMPQWKKDLIQRRKTNVARTSITGGATSAATTPQSPLPSPSLQQQQQQSQRFSGHEAGAEGDESSSPNRATITTTLTEETAEEFIIGGHYTPQVSSSSKNKNSGNRFAETNSSSSTKSSPTAPTAAAATCEQSTATKTTRLTSCTSAATTTTSCANTTTTTTETAIATNMPSTTATSTHSNESKSSSSAFKTYPCFGTGFLSTARPPQSQTRDERDKSSTSIDAAANTTKATAAAKTVLPTSSVFNALLSATKKEVIGATNNSSSNNTGSAPKIANKLQSNQFIKNQNKTTNTQDTTATAASKIATSKKMVAAAAATSACGRQPPDVVAGSNNNHSHNNSKLDLDASEDLSYGPGIVSKLRCRYLSLALRGSMDQPRQTLDPLRRTTSLNNLLERNAEDDDEDEDNEEEDEVADEQLETAVVSTPTNACAPKIAGGILKPSSTLQETPKKKTTFQKYNTAAFVTPVRMSQSQNDAAAGNNNVGSGNVAAAAGVRSRHVRRGNDSLKRARSVEALLGDKSPWHSAYNRSSLSSANAVAAVGSNRTSAATPPTTPTITTPTTHCNITIEHKISNARERLHAGTDAMPPKRLTSIIDDTERPPPDLVKQTLKKFEATANRRGRGGVRSNSNGEVANKVANYSCIIKDQKPAILLPKPAPLSPSKRAVAAAKPALKPSTPPAAADLLDSPLGRKASAAAAAASIDVGLELQHSSTPKTHKQLPPACLEFTPSKAGGGSGVLATNSPDIIPRQKLLGETAVDSPVTALTKKLEKLRIDTDKAKQPQEKQQSGNVIPKECQTNNKAPLHSATEEFVGGDAAAAALPATTANGKHKNKSDDDDNNHDNNHDANDDDDNNKNNDKQPQRGNHDRLLLLEPASAQSGTGSTSSDLSDDEYGRTKRVTRAALENIAKAGTTQQFTFGASNSSKLQPQQQINQGNKSKTEAGTELPNVSTTTNTTGVKQIGVLRPLLTKNSSSNSVETSSATASSTESFVSAKNSQQHTATTTTLKQQQSHNTVSHTTHSSNNSSSNIHASNNIHSSNNAHLHTPPPLTSREIEKNRINEMKKTADIAAGVSAATAASATSATSLDTVIVSKHTASSSFAASSSSSSSYSELDAAATITHNSSPLWALQTKKKRQPPAAVAENNSMVFNFSNRKEVPDYIENDGVVIRRKRELPKPNESGFVLLGDLSLETSTDTDYDDYAVCPPSPCDVEFENANIVIDGKSSIRQNPKEATFRVQFNDTLTSTFEYPSEASLIVDDSMHEPPYNAHHTDFVSAYENLMLQPAFSETDSPKHHHHVAVDEIIPLPTPANTTNNSTAKILGSLPLGSAPLSYYTPTKAPIDNLFQLGVTRAPTNGSSNGHTTQNATTNGTTTTPTTKTSIVTNGSGGVDSGHATPATCSENDDEPESLQYLKPANDDLTIAYSEGAQKTDLLY